MSICVHLWFRIRSIAWLRFNPGRRLVCLAAAGLLWSGPVLAFANLPIGAVVENVTLPALAGGQQKLLGETNVNVFVFIKPGLAHSNQALVEIAECQKELAGKPVHWCALVSDRLPKAETESAVVAAGLDMPVLIDTGDALFGKFGVILYPSIGITDPEHKLVAYLPFAKVNYGAMLRASVLHALKEISDEELAQALHPPSADLDEAVSVARRYFKLAEKQYQATNFVQSLTNLQKSLDQNPTAAAYSLRGQILAAQGNKTEALAAFEAALKLDPENATALQGKRACQAAAPAP